MELDEFNVRWCVERLREESDKQMKFMFGPKGIVAPLTIEQVYALRTSLMDSSSCIRLLEGDIARAEKKNKKFKFFRRK